MQLPRGQKKELKGALRRHDPEAARLLLAHSIALGHDRLALCRYFAARFLGADDLEPFVSFCRDVARRLKPDALLTAAKKVAGDLHLEVDIHDVLGELIVAHDPLVLPYSGGSPRLGGGPRYCGPGVSLLGRLEIGSDPWFGAGSVVRGDGHFVHIGDDFHIGERSTVHIAHELFPVLIGNRVTAGRNVVIHACTIGDDCVIEDDAIILDGTQVESGVLIEAGSTVFPRSVLQSGWVYSGSPAKPVRQLANGELEKRGRAASDAVFASILQMPSGPNSKTASAGADVFIAATASLRGKIEVGDSSGIFFGCKLNGVANRIAMGPDCNIQDNTIIDATEGPVVIGASVTIGHNADMASCIVGDRSLIGIGCSLAAGTVVDDDVLLAAGAVTKPGQNLERGWLWGGRPARPIAMLDDAKRAMMSATIGQYRTYAAQFRSAQLSGSPEED
jgi:gamma-carbonic anhydrase